MSTPALRFVEEDHTYWLGERRLPSVSELLSPIVDLSGIPAPILERKSQIGKAVHLACQFLDEGDEIEGELDPAIAGYVQGWRKFVAEMKPQWDLIEQPTASAKLGYAGTPDRRGVIAGKRWLVDIKTVAKISPVTGIQTAGYALLVEEPDINRAAVQLYPDGKFEWHPFTDAMDTPIFRSLLSINHWSRKHGRTS